MYRLVAIFVTDERPVTAKDQIRRSIGTKRHYSPARGRLAVGAACLLCLWHVAYSGRAFTLPSDSTEALQGVNIDGQPIGMTFKARFAECDGENTCDGRLLRYGCRSEPNNNSVLLKLSNGVIFFDGKLGIDADGSSLARSTPGTTNQPQTSMRYPLPNRPSIDSERVPYVVVPLGGFEKAVGVSIGDVAAVVYGGKRVYAVVGDRGPPCKIGEGSIRLHEELGHPVCKARTSKGGCARISNKGIERNVLYFIFPGTRESLYEHLTPEDINARIDMIGSESWQKLQKAAR